MKAIFTSIVILIVFLNPAACQPPGVHSGFDILSLSYSMYPNSKNAYLNSMVMNQNDAINGVSFNYGSPLTLSVVSSASYYISISSRSLYNSNGSANTHNQDLRNFIFFQIIENETGGHIVGNITPFGYVLGETERSILINCTPTITNQNYQKVRTFGLIFKVYPGYSLPPGTFTTDIVLTATFE